MIFEEEGEEICMVDCG